VETNTT